MPVLGFAINLQKNVMVHGASVWCQGDDHGCQLIFSAHCQT